MTMAFKYQVLLCPRPKDILLVSFNHMDAIKDFVKDTPSILSQVDETYRQLIEVPEPCFRRVNSAVECRLATNRKQFDSATWWMWIPSTFEKAMW